MVKLIRVTQLAERRTKHDRILSYLSDHGVNYSRIAHSLGRRGVPVLRLDHTLRAIGSRFSRFNERVVEYPWVLNNLDKNGQKILDVGTAESLLTFELIRRGYDVYGIDFRPFKGRHRLLHFCRGDICHAPYRPRSFDQIVALSTIEHIGLGAYGDPIRSQGDFLAVREMKELLKDGGKILITTPFAKKSHRTWQRIYDLESIKTLSPGLTTEKIEIFGRNQQGVWARSSISRFDRKELFLSQGVACMILRNGSRYTPNGFC